MSSVYEGRTVVVTGGAGSIGMELCREALAGGAETLKIVSLTESGLYNAMRGLRADFPAADLVPVLGSYGNGNLMARTLRGAEVLIHAGAHKHVPLCEANPLEAIDNNVLAAHVLLREARVAGVARTCVISSDKAVAPTSIMGATKRVVERMAMSADKDYTDVMVVRFGNVLDSAGSVLPLWREQIAAGGPLTLTDERCERYFMSIRDAVNLITFAIELGNGGKIYVLEMGERQKLIDIARALIAESGQDVPIKLTGLRPGEKLVEELAPPGSWAVKVAERISMLQDNSLPVDPAEIEALGYAYRTADTRRALDILWRMAA